MVPFCLKSNKSSTKNAKLVSFLFLNFHEKKIPLFSSLLVRNSVNVGQKPLFLNI